LHGATIMMPLMPHTLIRGVVVAARLFPAIAQAGPGPAPPPPEGRLVTVDQVVTMTKAGVSDTVILALINRDRPVFIINSVQLVQLRKDGVSEYLLQTMLMTPYFWQPLVPLLPGPVAAPPPPTRGIFFTRPTRGIFFK
jgi:hypothetical protein